MFGKGSKLYSIFGMKCPRCHEGEFFKSKNAYDFKYIFDMHEKCPVCGQTYNPEPNFYYGSMYVSYAYTVAIFVSVYVTCKSIIGLSLWQSLGVLGIVLLVIGPYLYRISRITWLNFFVKYDKRQPE